MLRPMRSEASGDVLKVWLYAAAAVWLGAWTAPLLYNAGKALAEVSSVKQTNGLLEWLAGVCRAAQFPGFFQASLWLAGGLLFLPFAGSLRVSRRLAVDGQRLLANPRGLRQGVTGFLLVTALFLLIAGVLILAGVLAWKSPGESLPRILLRATATALGLAVFQEIVFRGVVLGIFLRALRPAVALGASALLFALVHLLVPPPGMNVPDPDASGVGFELLRQIANRFFSLPGALASFAPLLAFGVVLAHARWRTASLWLPIGLHGGWMFVNTLLGSVTLSRSSLWVVSGDSLRQGLIPLLGILLAGLLADYLTTEVHDAAA
jgi:membrane protease YdiL (CAAX protease family)